MSALTLTGVVVRPFERFRLLSRLVLLVLLPLLFLVGAAVYNAEREFNAAVQSALDTAATMARQAAARLDEHFDELDQFLIAVAEVGRDALVNGEDVDPRLQRMLSAMPQHVNGLSVLSLDGRMVATTTASAAVRAGVRVADRSYFREALVRRALAVDEPVLSRTNNQWVSIAALPVFDEKGAVIGMVSMSTRVDRFHDVLVPLGLPLGALMTVFNERGIGISSTEEPLAAIGRDFKTSATVRRALRELVFSARTAASDGRERLTAYASGEKLRWIVEVGLPIEETLAPARERLYERLIYIFGAFLVGSLVAYWLARWISKPLIGLAGTADHLAAGDMNTRATASGYYEVKRLGTAFNNMASAVQAKQRELIESEARFRSLVFLSSDWYWTQDAEHRFTSHTQGRFGDIAMQAADFRGKTRWDMPGAEPVGTTWEAHRALLNERKTWRDLTVRYTDSAGEVQYISSSGEPVFAEDGTFTGYRGVARLVTDNFRLEAQRDAAAAALRESEAKFRALTALSSDWYWEQDAELRFTSIGRDDVRQALPIIGKRLEELNAQPVSETWEEYQARLARREKFRDVLFRYATNDGAAHFISVSGEPKFDDSGKFQGYRGTGTDVTERMQLQNQLGERMNLFQVTMDTTPVAMGLIRRRDNEVLLANQAAHDLFRVASGKHWNVLENWERPEDLQEMLRRVKEEGYARDMEVPLRIAGRDTLWASLSAQRAQYQGEAVMIVTVADITGRKVMEREREALLAEARRANERLTHLSRQVLDVQEAERRKIAHELHDEIGQNLTALKLFAGHLRGEVKTEAQPRLDEWIDLLNSSIEQVRDLSRILRPVQLDLMGLAPALRALLYTQARAAGWTAEFTADAEGERIDSRVETVVYRVVQEALSNAARHADAACVTLELYVERDKSGGKLTLRIADDGRGYDVNTVRAQVQQGRSMGLLGMEERVRLVGGSFSVESAPTRGTRITVTIPFAAELQKVTA